MNTPTHLLVAAAAFARPDDRRRNIAALFGAALPDLSLYGMVAWERFVNGRSFQQIFDVVYFSRFWQTVFAIDNSIPLYVLLVGVGVAAKAPWLWVLAGAALLHIALDLPVHHDDGRPHFQPFTDWIYQSPISYWDSTRYGDVVGLVETLAVVAIIILLWRRFRSTAVRGVLVVAGIAQISTSAMWAFLLPS